MPKNVDIAPTVVAPTVQSGPEDASGDVDVKVKDDVTLLDTTGIINFFTEYENEPDSSVSVFKEAARDKLKSRGINVDHISNILGSGTYGTAYTYGDKVLKATGDMSEVASSAAIINMNIPGVVEIFKVFAFPEGLGKSIRLKRPTAYNASPQINKDIVMGWILQERLYPLSGGELTKIKDITERRDYDRPGYKAGGYYLATLVKMYMLETDSGKAADIRNNIMKQLKREHGATEAYPGFWEAITGLKKAGVKFWDIHSGNLMADTSGKIKIIDLGISKSVGGRKPDEIKLEHILWRMRHGLL